MGGGGLSIESRNTRVFKRGRRAALLIAALTPAVLLSGVSWQLVAGVIVALEMLRRLEAARWARSRSALVRTSNDDLVIERNGSHFRMKKSAITDCWQVPDTESGGTRVMVVSRRAQVSMLVSDRASADALGHALGMNPSAHVVGARDHRSRLDLGQTIRRRDYANRASRRFCFTERAILPLGRGAPDVVLRGVGVTSGVQTLR